MSATDTQAAQLMELFGARLKMVAAFGSDSNTCAVVESLTIADLDGCAALSAAWKRLGLDPPLLMLAGEISRALDAFPLEFSEIIATKRLIVGTDLFEAMVVPAEDLRRACEVQARGHLVHLREAYIEAAGDYKAVAQLVSASVIPFRALLLNIARLDGTTVDDLMKKLEQPYVTQGFPECLKAAERVVEYTDKWNRG
jgi:hypothetical protein